MARHYDIVIIGGNLVGAVFACMLQRMADSGCRVALIDTQDPQTVIDTTQTALTGAHESTAGWIGSYDPRVFAVNLGSERIFAQLGLWEQVERMRAAAFQRMYVWDQQSSARIGFDAAEIYQPKLGSIVEQRVLLTALYRRLVDERSAQEAAVDFFAPSRVRRLEKSVQGTRVVLEDGTELETVLLVGADGTESIVREYAGIDVLGWSYHQTAIVATLATERAHESTAWQRFLPGGPLAFLPLQHGLCSIVWSVGGAEAGRLLEHDDAQFMLELEQAFESRLGRITATGPRYSFPLRMLHAKDYCRPGVVLLGNAAHTIHPLAGQGVNLGMQDAAVLAQSLLKHDFPRPDRVHRALREYERRRKGENLLMLGAMDLFNRAFGSTQFSVRLARLLGMRFVDRCTMVKKVAMRRALGVRLY